MQIASTMESEIAGLESIGTAVQEVGDINAGAQLQSGGVECCDDEPGEDDGGVGGFEECCTGNLQ